MRRFLKLSMESHRASWYFLHLVPVGIFLTIQLRNTIAFIDCLNEGIIVGFSEFGLSLVEFAAKIAARVFAFSSASETNFPLILRGGRDEDIQLFLTDFAIC